jgi:hypothetical protein
MSGRGHGVMCCLRGGAHGQQRRHDGGGSTRGGGRTPASARCPGCRRPSRARHSRYWRTLRDVVAHGRSVTLRVPVSRWRCHHAPCETAIFADRLAGVAAPHTNTPRDLGGRASGRACVRRARRRAPAQPPGHVSHRRHNGAPSSGVPRPPPRTRACASWALTTGRGKKASSISDDPRRF